MDERSMRHVSILIVNFYTAALVVDLVDSIRTYLRRYGCEILILDNSVDCREREILSSISRSDVRLVLPDHNMGFVAGNNLLLAEAQAEMVMVLNPDTKLQDSSCADLLEYVFQHHEVGVGGPMLLNADGSYQVSFYRFPTLWTLGKEHLLFWPSDVYAYRRNTHEVQQCDVVKGTCLVMRTSIAREVSLFDPDLVMYSEEVDLCLRLKRRGLSVVYYPLARIIHFGEQSSKKESASEYALFHYYRSKRILFRKHYTKFEALVASWMLGVSLLERAVLLQIFGKKTSGGNHWKVLKRLYFRGEVPAKEV